MRAMTAGDVRVRAATARQYLEVGDLVHGEPDDPAERQVDGRCRAAHCLRSGARIGRRTERPSGSCILVRPGGFA